MQENPKYTARGWIPAAAAVGLLAALSSGAQTLDELDDAHKQGEYYWYADLVALDAANDTATLEAYVAPHADTEAIAALAEGDQVTLTWSGIRWGSAVLDMSKTGAEAGAKLTLPVEFVAADPETDYVSFRVTIPSESEAGLANLEAGAAVVGRSPQGAGSGDRTPAVISLEPYHQAG